MSWNAQKLLLLLTVLFAATGAYALTCEKDYARVGEITFATPVYEGACAKFEWVHSQTAADFNNYVVSAAGGKTVGDFNTTAKSFDACSIEPGASETIFVRAYDGNATGRFCSFDYNATLNSGTIYNAGRYIAYVIFTVFAAIIGLIVIVTLVCYAVEKLSLRIPWLRK